MQKLRCCRSLHNLGIISKLDIGADVSNLKSLSDCEKNNFCSLKALVISRKKISAFNQGRKKQRAVSLTTLSEDLIALELRIKKQF